MRGSQFFMVSVMIVSLTLIAYDIEAITGNDWQQLSKAARDAYIWGVLDSWHNIEGLAEFMVEKKRLESQNPLVLHYTRLLNCIEQKMSYAQLSAIVEKYIKNKPESRHYVMPSLVWSAIYNTCKPTSK